MESIVIRLLRVDYFLLKRPDGRKVKWSFLIKKLELLLFFFCRLYKKKLLKTIYKKKISKPNMRGIEFHVKYDRENVRVE